MGRPRKHDLDDLLDAAEALLAESGHGALTVRAVADAVGGSTGSLYHAFRSRNELLGQMWLRAARRFLDVQREVVDACLQRSPTREGAVEATIAAASSYELLRRQHPTSAQLLMEYRRDALLDDGLPDDLAGQLRALEGELVDVMRRLAVALWGRADRYTVDAVAVCVVDLPPGLLNGWRPRVVDPLDSLAAAVRGVLATTPPSRNTA